MHRASGRQPRANLDSLAIGAPLTAALIGVLLTEGDAAFGQSGAGSSSAGGSATRHGSGEAGNASERSAPASGHDAAGEGAALAAASGSTSGEIFDPIAATDAAALNSAPSDGGTGGLAPLAAASAAMGAQATLFGDINIAVGTGAPPEDGLGLNSGSDASAGAGVSSGRIGVTIVGTDGDDIIHGTPYDDRLFGGPGDDTIYGYEGDDLLDGGPGNDSLFGGPGNDRLLGGSGNDRLFGGTGDDNLSGGAGQDQLFGEEGLDKLDGGPDDDILDGGPGPDRLIGGRIDAASTDPIRGSDGNDILIVDDIHDVAFGDGWFDVPGNNTLVVQAAFATHLLEQMGEQRATFVLSENFGQSLPAGVAGYSQQVAGDIQNVTLEGTAKHGVVGDSRANVIWGNDGDNKLYGGSGDDILHGSGGNDELRGGIGDDELHGDSGNDRLFGESGDDILRGGAGDDTLRGGAGDDLLYGDAGNDNFVIGLNDSGVDTVFDHEGLNWLTIEGGAGHRVQTALAGDQLYVVVDDSVVAMVDGYRGHEAAWAGIDTGAGLRTIDELMAPGAAQGPGLAGTSTAAASTLQADNDLLGAYLTRPSLQGTAGADYLPGTSGPDWLRGGAGDDHLVGGDGRDVLEGEAGRDLLEGGGGDDRYLFKWGDGSWDIIHDTEGANVVQIDGVARTNLAAVVSGKNLVVVADSLPVFTFEDFVGHEQAFAGLQVGNEVLSADDLLS